LARGIGFLGFSSILFPRRAVFLISHYAAFRSSAQFYVAALKAHPEIPQEISKGGFGTLHSWLRDNLYQHGSKFAPNDLVERATGAVMQMRPYLDYLHEKYGALYRQAVRTDQAFKAH
jgi:Carboxypeptidase Taq (M32) metallopeptidase